MVLHGLAFGEHFVELSPVRVNLYLAEFINFFS